MEPQDGALPDVEGADEDVLHLGLALECVEQLRLEGRQLVVNLVSQDLHRAVKPVRLLLVLAPINLLQQPLRQLLHLQPLLQLLPHLIVHVRQLPRHPLLHLLLQQLK